MKFYIQRNFEETSNTSYEIFKHYLCHVDFIQQNVEETSNTSIFFMKFSNTTFAMWILYNEILKKLQILFMKFSNTPFAIRGYTTKIFENFKRDEDFKKFQKE